MQKTKIFLSSTYFDLSQIREDIRATINQMGHEPLLNEYSSFPTLPDLNTIENCKKAVQCCDLFVLIVGGRRGSLDAATGKSITNIEYETAKESGIDCFVFIQDQVAALIPTWQKNPDADFVPAVDSSQVFEFIESIQKSQKWIFTFKRASEISEILKTQLSVFFQSLLSRRKAGNLDPIREFAQETGRARQLALDRPRFWEYLLTAELLESNLASVTRHYANLDRGLLFRPQKRVSARDYMDWLQSAFHDAMSLADIITVCINNEIPSAWGKPGEPGNAVEILYSVNTIVGVCHALLNWETEVRSVTPPSGLTRLKASLEGLTKGMIDAVSRLPGQLSESLKGEWTGQRVVNIKLTIPTPPQLEAFRVEMEEVRKHPEWLSEE
jgi:hypothetical protein